MTEQYDQMTDVSPSNIRSARPWHRAIIWPTLFFVGGIGLTGWFLTSTEMGANLLSRREPTPIAIDADRLNQPPAPAPAFDQSTRIAELEARVARAEAAVSNNGGAGSGSSSRINGLVLTFAARRALDRGQRLGPIESELKAQFGATSPHLVAAVSAAAAAPVTLAQIKTEFATLAPSLTSESDGWWSRLTASLSGLVSIRSSTSKSNDPAQLVDHAQKALDAGQVSDALSDVVSLPNRAAAGGWMTKARRYSEAQAALDALEASVFAAPPSPTEVPPPAPVMPSAEAPTQPGSSSTF